MPEDFKELKRELGLVDEEGNYYPMKRLINLGELFIGKDEIIRDYAEKLEINFNYYGSPMPPKIYWNADMISAEMDLKKYIAEIALYYNKYDRRKLRHLANRLTRYTKKWRKEQYA